MDSTLGSVSEYPDFGVSSQGSSLVTWTQYFLYEMNFEVSR